MCLSPSQHCRKSTNVQAKEDKEHFLSSTKQRTLLETEC
jgi:hypothetical protein